MINHIEFKSDCKRIAKEIMKQANDVYGDAIAIGKVTVYISSSLVTTFNQERYKHVPKWVKEINKNLKGCKVSFDSLGNDSYWFISFNIEYDDVDVETED